MNRKFSLFVFALTLAVCSIFAHSQVVVSPFEGLGNAQFFDNNGELLTAGALYSYQAGTTTQQATYADSTGTVLNVNPLPFGSGARASIWLASTSTYKFVLCLQNDGPTCAPADVLFSVDQVPGGSGGGGGGGGGTGTFTGTFISGSSNPSSAGIVRFATGDSFCWRNAAGTTNLCVSKDSNDVLDWVGGAFKIPEIACSNTATGFDYLCASNVNHRWMMANNGGGQTQIVGAGVDVNNSDQVTGLHFGSTAAPLSLTAPATAQFLQWDGAHIVGDNIEATFGWGIYTYSPGGGTYTTCSGTGATQACVETIFQVAHTLLRFTWNLTASPSGCSTNPIIGVRDLTAGSNLYTVTVNAQPLGFQDSGALSTTIPANHAIGVGVLTSPSAPCAVALVGVTMVYQ